MNANQADAKGALSVRAMCRVLGVSHSGYYDWRDRPPSARAVANAILTERIRQVHRDSDETYGMRRVRAQLRHEGQRASRKRVARLMREACLRGVSRRRGFTVTTERNVRARPAPDLVNRQFVADAPNVLWVADMTYIPTWTGFLYLAVVLDAFSRKVVGWAMGEQMTAELVIAALNMALHTRRPASVIHHSDQGSQYTSLAFGGRCREMGVKPSMGTVGDAYDNAMAESFFATLECELDRPALLAQQGRSENGAVHMDRELVQPTPAALGPELRIAHQLRGETRREKRSRPKHRVTHRVGRFVASADRRRG